MKPTSNKRLYLFAASILLLLLLVLPIRNYFMNVEASSNEYQIRMLEVTESGASELTTLKSGLTNLTIDTMSMKRFVALRDDLDGKYDAVYIGKGTYSASGVSGNNHNTKTVMNDITDLKAKEITDYFINKGLYVIFNKQPFTASVQNGVLYTTFRPYLSESAKKNVLFVDEEGLRSFFSDLKSDNSNYLAGLQQRPRLSITNRSEIIDYSKTPGKIYKAGDELTFNFTVSNASKSESRPILAKLYLGLDKSIKMTEEQVVATTTLNGTTNGVIKYKLPKTYSGLLYWKLEVIDSLDQKLLMDFDSGAIRYRYEKTIVKVLQVLPDDNRDSSLLDSKIIKQSLLEDEDYQLVINPVSMSEFNKYIKDNETKQPQYGLNGVYDMLLFGFRDVYNEKSPINELSADAVVDFIVRTKQSAMFTHDTIYGSSSQWIEKFQPIIGQERPQTNLGLKAPNTSTTVTPVNDGLLTQYPFNLSKQAGNNNVAITHNQYFTLDLNDANVVPWYNITGNSRDIDDSWNHYYTYSKGNITYSGTGHIIGTSYKKTEATSFPDWEQKLFVNTMYRAFMGANHAPKITVHTPINNSTKPSYQDKLVVSYTVDDLDLKDRNLFTSIQFKQNDTVIEGFTMSEKAVISGDTVTQTFTNPLPEGGKLQIEITARDRQGALSTETVNVTVKRIDPNISLHRTQSAASVERGQPITFEYSITPNDVPYYVVDPGEQGIEKLAISEIRFEETFPPYLEFSEPLPEGFTRSGTLSEGYTLRKNLDDITYTLSENNNVKVYKPVKSKAVTFSLTAVPQRKDTYQLEKSTISYVDIHAATTTFPGSTAPVSPLGIANDYSVFMLGNINFTNSGFSNNWRMAAGGNIRIGSFNLGSSLEENDKGATLVAGGNLYLSQSGGSFRGNAYYGGNLDIPNYLHATKKESFINFTTVGENIKNRSIYYNSLAQTSKPEPSGNSITLKGNDSGLNVFHVTPVGGTINSLTIDAPPLSTVIVNVSGTSVTLTNGSNNLLGGVKNNNVLYNFYEAKSLILQGYGIKGTILAPLADITFSGDIWGSVIGNSIAESNGGHSITLHPLTSEQIPEPPTPTQRERVTINFSPLSFEALVKVTKLELADTEIRVDSELMLLPSVIVTPDDASTKEVSWISEQPNILSVSDTGVIKGLSAGLATLKITARDGSEIFTTATVRVISPDLSIEGVDHAVVGDKVSFKATYTTVDENIIGYEWSIKPGSNSDKAKITKTSDSTEGSTAILESTVSGKFTIIATVKTDRKPNGATFSKEHTIRFTNPVQTIRVEGDSFVRVGNKISLEVVVVSPAENSDPTEYVWSLEGDGSNYATIIPDPIDSKRIQLLGNAFTDSVIVKVSTNWSSPNTNVEAYARIAVGTILTQLSLPEALQMRTGSTKDLFNDELTHQPQSMNKNDLKGKLIWTSSNPSILSVSENGEITALKIGRATINVTYKDNPQIQDSVDVKVVNEDRY